MQRDDEYLRRGKRKQCSGEDNAGVILISLRGARRERQKEK
jgi:hypothetical protein